MNYDYWHGLLALGERAKADRELRTPGEPQPGFYRTSHGKPVAIWYDGDGCNFLINGEQVIDDLMEEEWHFVCRSAVTQEAYRTRMETGQWGDVDPAISETLGHNIEGVDDAETIQRLLDRLKEAAAQYVKVTSDEVAKRAHSLRARIGQLRLRAQTLHKAEKEPHLKAGQAVDRKWNPMVKDAQTTEAALGRAMGAWEDDKRMELRRREIEAEAARRANEPAPALPPAPEPKEQIRSGYGRAASVKVKDVVVGISDFDALIAAFRDSDTLRGFLMELAQRNVDAGITVPGVIVEQRSVVR